MYRYRLEEISYNNGATFEYVLHFSASPIASFIPISEEMYNKMRELTEDVDDESHDGVIKEQFALTFNNN
jgi:hypothetical protein